MTLTFFGKNHKEGITPMKNFQVIKWKARLADAKRPKMHKILDPQQTGKDRQLGIKTRWNTYTLPYKWT